ncbi:MAG TPA: trigger factor, partial [Candidatus Didemnitutus sp.]|nr:trigger factor [Candidatus Didemnitutus sp.]
EAFFKFHQVDDLEGLKTRLRADMTMRNEMRNRSAQRRQVTEALIARAEFPVPESMLASERDAVLRQFMEENIRRGVPQEQFEQNKRELYDGATRAATGRVKVQLLLGRIAEEEKIKVEEKDINQWLVRESMRSGQRPEKLAKELGRNRDELHSVQRQILLDKTLDFLVAKATVKTATAKA